MTHYAFHPPFALWRDGPRDPDPGERAQVRLSPTIWTSRPILAASAGGSPSVVQIRTQDLLSDDAVSFVAKAIEAHREDINRGALLSIDEGGTRVRMLPLKDAQNPS